jgi:hypothetical protein
MLVIVRLLRRLQMLKLKKMFLVMLVALTTFLVGFATGKTDSASVPKNQNPLTATVEQQREEINSLKSGNKALERGLDTLHRVLEKDWRFALREIDDSLDAVERKDEYAIQGSYTDWFVPTLQDLKSRGVGVWRLQTRFDRLVSLAKQGKYLSSYEHDLVNREGIEGLQRSTSAILQ